MHELREFPVKSNQATVFIALLILGSMPATATFVPTDEERVTGWHVVRPGENLEIITNYYLGDPSAWPENAALNPGVNNPNLIFPGQRVKVLLHQGIPSGSAQLTELGSNVDQQPTPISWRDAQQSDLLRERDGIRTGSDSSAQLEFADGTQVTVSEDSLLFLRGNATLARPLSRDPQEVEILVGQADLAAVLVDTNQPPVEIVIGATRARPTPSPGGSMATRARRPDSGGAQVMVFEGESKVESAGESISVAAGMGTIVPEAGPPAEPEVLLAAPTLRHPAAGLKLKFANPEFSWAPVSGAESYVVDVCADPECADLVVRQAGIRETSWKVAALSAGERYWRTSAVSSKGLDGFPSEPRPLSILSNKLDKTKLSARIVAVGQHSGLGQALVLAEGTTLETRIVDPSGGSAHVELVLDGEPVGPEALRQEWQIGNHQITGTLVSGQGDRTPIKPAPFIYDTEAPVFDWQVGSDETIAELYGLDQDEKPKKAKRKIKTNRDVPLLWSVDGILWTPVLAPNDRDSKWDINCDTPQFFLRTRKNFPFGADPSLAFEKGQLMRIQATDEHSAISQLTLRATPTGSGYEISLEARDLVKNTQTRRWRIDR